MRMSSGGNGPFFLQPLSAGLGRNMLRSYEQVGRQPVLSVDAHHAAAGFECGDAIAIQPAGQVNGRNPTAFG